MASDDKQRAFVAALATRHAGTLRHFFATRIPQAAAVPDLIQEVFLRLLRVERPEAIRSPEAYLFTIAKHVLFQHKAQQHALPEAVDILDVLAELQDGPEVGPESQLEAKQRIAELERALEQLPPRAYVTLILNRVNGLPLEQIAARLGVSRPMAKKYLAKALTYCRQRDPGNE